MGYIGNKNSVALYDSYTKAQADGSFAPISLVDDVSTIDSGFENRVSAHLNAGGAAPIYACRAWVNFNGTGTVAIRASGNVSSITDNGIGDYTVNFAFDMPDVDFSVNGTSSATSPTTGNTLVVCSSDNSANYTVSGVRVFIKYQLAGGTPVDGSFTHISVFR